MGKPLHHVFISKLQLVADLEVIFIDLVPDAKESVVIGSAIGEAVRMRTRLKLEKAIVEAVLDGI